MKYAARILIPVLASMTLLPGTMPPAISVAQPSPPAVPSPQLVEVGEPAVEPTSTTVTGGTEQQRALVAWALQQYENAGLDLPVLQFHLALDPSTCGGNRGFFALGTTPWLITLCTEERIVFLHEVGHAWSAYTLTPSERAEYVEQQEMESWNDPETPWRARGSEDAANILAWGLIDDQIRGMTPDGRLAHKNEAFHLLTGIDSPRITEGEAARPDPGQKPS
jgi:hypothetical protein